MFSLEQLKEVQSYFQNKMEAGGGWNALFYSNHDQPRALSRFGNDTFYREESAKLLAITLFGLQGTTYIYQGEELGMKSACFETLEEYNDRESTGAYKQMRKEGVSHEEALLILKQKSRDNARTPMQWDNTKHHGFSQGEPWLASNPDRISAENELKNADSVFYTYQRLIQYRKQYDIFTEGSYRLLEPAHPQLFMYERVLEEKRLLVASNFSSQWCPLALPKEYEAGQILESNYGRTILKQNMELKPYESLMILLNP